MSPPSLGASLPRPVAVWAPCGLWPEPSQRWGWDSQCPVAPGSAHDAVVGGHRLSEEPRLELGQPRPESTGSFRGGVPHVPSEPPLVSSLLGLREGNLGPWGLRTLKGHCFPFRGTLLSSKVVPPLKFLNWEILETQLWFEFVTGDSPASLWVTVVAVHRQLPWEPTSWP